jgi:hypothetical protein
MTLSDIRCAEYPAFLSGVRQTATKLCFFVGNDGVGKTTVSAAYAVHSALSHAKQPVLPLSTGPAHSLSEVFQRLLWDDPARMQLPAREIMRMASKRREAVPGIPKQTSGQGCCPFSSVAPFFRVKISGRS